MKKDGVGYVSPYRSELKKKASHGDSSAKNKLTDIQDHVQKQRMSRESKEKSTRHKNLLEFERSRLQGKR